MKSNPFNKKMRIPLILTIIGTLLMILSILLPYTTATSALDSELAKNPGIYTNPTMIDYAKEAVDSSQTVIVILIAVFALLSLIFAVFKKAVISIVFIGISSAVFAFQCYDFCYREIINVFYTWGIGFYIYIIAAALALGGSIWLLTVNKKYINS